jgi:hypothetical protein
MNSYNRNIIKMPIKYLVIKKNYLFKFSLRDGTKSLLETTVWMV